MNIESDMSQNYDVGDYYKKRMKDSIVSMNERSKEKPYRSPAEIRLHAAEEGLGRDLELEELEQIDMESKSPRDEYYDMLRGIARDRANKVKQKYSEE